HEANVWPGLANRMLGRIVDRVYLGTSRAMPHFPEGKTLVTGLPLRVARDDDAGRTRDGSVHVLVLSGSRGGRFLGTAAPAIVARLKESGRGVFAVRHQSSDATAALIAAAYDAAGVSAVVSEFIDDISDAYRWADVAIARAGAGTLAELAAFGVPALL